MFEDKIIIPLEFYDHIRDQVRLSDIVRKTVNLQKKGSEYVGLCPFHAEKSPSFTVNDYKKFYHCFGCAAHGDVIKFLSGARGISYKQAAIIISQEYGIALPKISAQQKKTYQEMDHLSDILSMAEKFFVNQMTDQAMQYLLGRNLNREIIKKFNIGYSPEGGKLIKFLQDNGIALEDALKAGVLGKSHDNSIYNIFHNRVMFPIKNTYGKTIAFGGRVLNQSLPKYINSPETILFKKNQTMYGENIAISAAHQQNRVILVEGYLDALALQNNGFPETVASLGTAVTAAHLQKLWNASSEIILCLDGDEAGARAAVRVIDLAMPIISANKKLSFIDLPQKMDPDSIIREEGTNAFKALLDSRTNLSEKIWNIRTENIKFSSAEEIAALEYSLASYVTQISDKPLAGVFKQYFKDKIWNFIKQKPKKQYKVEKSQGAFSVHQYTEQEVLERAMISMIINFPYLLKEEEILEFITNIELSLDNLSKIRDWVIDIFTKNSDLTEEGLKDIGKNSGFYELLLVLCSPDTVFLDIIFLKKNIDNKSRIFAWLKKQHYFLSLKKEYTNSLLDHSQYDQDRVSSYISEIQKTFREITELGESFLN